MGRTKLKEDDDYYKSTYDDVDLDEIEDFTWIDGVNHSYGRVHEPDVNCSPVISGEDVNFGVSVRQYEANYHSDFLNKESDKVNKGNPRARVPHSYTGDFNLKMLFARIEREDIYEGEDDE